MILFRHCDTRFPFLWEASAQPAARWHGEGDGPVQYLADTPSGAWAEFLRHEGIRDVADLEGVRRALWAVDVPEGSLDAREPVLPKAVLLGGFESYAACRKEARRLRDTGARALRAPSAALTAGGAGGWRVDRGERPAAPREGIVLALFGPQPRCTGWPIVEGGAAPERILSRVRHF